MDPRTHQTRLDEANAAVSRHRGQAAAGNFRPYYHFAPPSGWMNDPNGWIQWRGEYHLFFQHHPFRPEWGPMYWGHARSRDLIHWEYLPVALAPGEPYDADGCFSGSAVACGDELALLYTGHVQGPPIRESQCLAFSADGVNFDKYGQNPVLAVPPEGIGAEDFRDPKVWRENDCWYVVIGTRVAGRGAVLLYTSDDLVQWTFVSTLAQSDGTQGEMWECPDFFALGDRYVLLLSPIGLDRRKVIYAVGGFDAEQGRFDIERWGELDSGYDFYAAQSLLDDAGRRIVIAWMDSWDAHMPTQAEGWAGLCTLPRVLHLGADGGLLTHPVPEIERLRGESVSLAGRIGFGAGEVAVLNLPNWFAAEIDLTWRPGPGHPSPRIELSCTFGDETGSERVQFLVDCGQNSLRVNRESVARGNPGVSACVLGASCEGVYGLRLFVDRSSLEVFGSDGRLAVTHRIYPTGPLRSVVFHVLSGFVELEVAQAWRLELHTAELDAMGDV